MLIAAVVAVALVVGGVVWYVRRPGSSQASDDWWGVANFSSQPSVKWRRTLSQLAPGLGCVADTLDGSQQCDSQFASFTADGNTVVMVVTRGDKSDVVGVDRKTGTTKWTHAMAATPNCYVIKVAVWCTDESSAADTTTVTTFDPASGKQLGTVVIPGAEAEFGSQSYHVSAELAFDNGMAYVISPRKDAGIDQLAKITVTKMDVQAKPKWQRTLDVTAINDPNAYLGWVFEKGQLYIRGVKSDGRQVVLATADGSQVPGGPGQLLASVDGVRISRDGSGGLQFGGTPVPQSQYTTAGAWDGAGSTLTFLYDDPSGSDSSDSGSDTDRSYTVVNPKEPATPLFQLSNVFPMAECGGTLFVSRKLQTTDNGNSGTSPVLIKALDPKTGAVKWQQSGDAGQVWCSSGDLVLGGAKKIVKLNSSDGKVDWAVSVPKEPKYQISWGWQKQQGVLMLSGSSDQTVTYID